MPFAAAFRVPRRLPSACDLRAGCSPVEDQGALGSCTAQALAGAIEFLHLRDAVASKAPDDAHRKFTDLSRLFIYYNTRELMGTVGEDSGAMLRTGIKSLCKKGVCRESLWPYDIRRFTERPTPACYREALRCRVRAYHRLAALSEMKACLATGLPFVFGFAVYEHVMTEATSKSGRVKMPKRSERMVGGHAVMAVGYDDKRRVFFFRNSWGTQWGRAGYGEIPYAYLESRNLSDDFWRIQTATGHLDSHGKRA